MEIEYPANTTVLVARNGLKDLIKSIKLLGNGYQGKNITVDVSYLNQLLSELDRLPEGNIVTSLTVNTLRPLPNIPTEEQLEMKRYWKEKEARRAAKRARGDFGRRCF